MQRVCEVAAGIKGYLTDPGRVVNEDSRRCPFCRDGHALWLHGWYWRWVVLPDPERPQRVPIRRLVCAATGRTVSLLPAFCLPRRQHGPAVLARFLKFFLGGAGLLQALRQVRQDAPCHAVAQSLLGGFLKRAAKIRAYISQVRARALGPPADTPAAHREVAGLFANLTQGYTCIDTAFTFHACRFHQRFAEALA